MRQRLDRSPAVASLIKTLSNKLAQQRGLIPVVGIGLALLGYICLTVNVFVNQQLLELAGLLLQGIGILAALIGLLLAEPLGPGVRDKRNDSLP